MSAVTRAAAVYAKACAEKDRLYAGPWHRKKAAEREAAWAAWQAREKAKGELLAAAGGSR